MALPENTKLFSCIALFLLFKLSTPSPSMCAPVVLNDLEQYYVKTHGPVTLCVDPDWIPFEMINENGEHEGIAADLVRLVAERTGLIFKLVKTASWDESLAASKEGRCETLSFLNQTPEREKWLIFSDPLFRDSNVFITREEHPFIADPGELINESIVFPKGTSMEERVGKDYPNLRIITTDTENEAMNLVSERKADMTMRSLIVAAYTIKKEGLFNLKISGQLPNYSNALRVGISKKDATLRGIVNKGIATITDQERGFITNQHVSINVQTVVDYGLVFKILAAVCILAALGGVWAYQLKKHNRELARISQTDTLTGLPNRTKLNTRFLAEFERAQRYQRPLSLIMLDIDHFKNTNDEHGHLMGDRVLVEVGEVALKSIRACDTLGRWGGEEFLVVCPETTREDALHIAERIRKSIGEHPFSCKKLQTVSAGVATLASGDTMDSLLTRADMALYQAKGKGRNQVASLP